MNGVRKVLKAIRQRLVSLLQENIFEQCGNFYIFDILFYFILFYFILFYFILQVILKLFIVCYSLIHKLSSWLLSKLLFSVNSGLLLVPREQGSVM